MLKTLLTLAVSYAATNIDDLFLSLLFFSQAEGKRQQRAVVAGKFLGIGALMGFSMLGAAALRFAPQGMLRFLGLVPLWLGVRAALEKGEEQVKSPADASRGLALSVALITIANGGDNIGVYVPLFAGFSAAEYGLCALVFAALTALWCFLGKRLSDFPRVRAFLKRHKRVIVPLVLILLGVQILMG